MAVTLEVTSLKVTVATPGASHPLCRDPLCNFLRETSRRNVTNKQHRVNQLNHFDCTISARGLISNLQFRQPLQRRRWKYYNICITRERKKSPWLRDIPRSNLAMRILRRAPEIYCLSVNGSESFFITAVKFSNQRLQINRGERALCQILCACSRNC